MDLQLKGKRAIVTGGSRGIGKEITRALAQEGVDVVIATRTFETLSTAAAELARETGARIVPFAADTSDDAEVDALVAATIEALGGVDIIVNNAAVPGGAGFPGAKLADVQGQRLLDDVNVKVAGYLRTARAAAPYLVQNGWGRIINIGGLAARRTGNYIASVRNVAVSAVTKNLADEFGPQGITVNAIHPGVTRTEKTTPEFAAQAGANVTVGRVIDASEIAWLVTILASPKSIALNGQTLQAGGGLFGVIDY
jgi:NAD(P)-dependent dehydrogenase (short-subunit alcohol dehydrogenase family)